MSSFSKLQTCIQINKNTKVKQKHFIFIIQNNNKNRKHIKIKNKKDKFLKRKLKHEPNIVEITHLCIRHQVQTSILLRDPQASGTTNRKGSNYYWLRTSVMSASPSASHCLSIPPSTTSTPLCASSVTVRPRPPSSENLPSIRLNLPGALSHHLHPPPSLAGEKPNLLII